MGLPLRVKFGLKAMQLAEWAVGNRRWRSLGDDGPIAQPFVGYSALAAVANIGVVYSCVMRKAIDKASVPMEVGHSTKGGTFQLSNPASDPAAALLNNGNPEEGHETLWARSYAMQELTGDLFQNLEYGGTRTPEELWLLMSPEVEIVKGDDRRAKSYTYKGGITFTPEQVFHSRKPNPGNQWMGLAPQVAVQQWSWMEDLIARHGVNTLNRGGVPPGILSFAEYIPPEDRDELRAMITRQYGGPENAGRIGLTWGDAKFYPTGMSTRDGEWLNLDDRAVRKVASAHGVPLILLMDLADASYANAVYQEGGYWLHTIQPELKGVAGDWTRKLQQLFRDKSYEVRHNFDRVDALAALRVERAKQLVTLVVGGILTQNEARAEIGKPPTPGGDVLFAPQLASAAGSVGGSGGVAAPNAKVARAISKWIDDPARNLKRAAVGSSMEEHATRALADQQNLERVREARILRNFHAAVGKSGKALTKESASDLIDVEVEVNEQGLVLLRVHTRTVGDRGQSAIEEVFPGDRFDIGAPRVQAWLAEQGGAASVLIVDTLKDQLASTLAAAFADNLNTADTAGKLKEMFDLRFDSYALRIARTETAKAYNFGTREGWKQSEVVSGKEWLSAEDDQVRGADPKDEFSHVAADGEVVPLDDPFEKTGEPMDYPCDPAGSAGNIINCRCAMVPHIDEGAKAARLARRKIVTAGSFAELFAGGPARVAVG